MTLLLELCAALVVQAPPAPTPAAPEPLTIVRAARMVDVKSGKLVERPEIRIQGKHIVAVVNEGAAAPPEARMIDLGDVTLLPGLIDVHTHLSFELGPESAESAAHETLADLALAGAKHARITLAAGFTTVRDVGSGGFVDVALMRAIERGDIEGPWIVPAGHAISITGGHGDVTGFAPSVLLQTPETGVADGVDECLKAVRTQIKYGAKVIKIMATAGVLSFEESVGAQQLSFEEMKAIVDEAARHGIKVAAHAHGAEGIKQAIRAGVASIEHGSLLDDEGIELMLAQGTYLVPTQYLVARLDLSKLPEVWKRKAEYLFPRKDEGLRKAIARGVKIAFGTDAGVFPHGENAKEFASYVALGMQPIDAIRTATLNAAELLGTNDRGTLENGKLADLVAVEGNPLEDIHALERVRWVMRAGRVASR